MRILAVLGIEVTACVTILDGITRRPPARGVRLHTLRPVKPCPGVPGIHLNADRTISMTAALLCGAGASPVHKDRGCSADHDQIEDHAHAQRHAWEILLWLKNGAHGRRARLARARTP